MSGIARLCPVAVGRRCRQEQAGLLRPCARRHGGCRRAGNVQAEANAVGARTKLVAKPIRQTKALSRPSEGHMLFPAASQQRRLRDIGGLQADAIDEPSVGLGADALRGAKETSVGRFKIIDKQKEPVQRSLRAQERLAGFAGLRQRLKKPVFHQNAFGVQVREVKIEGIGVFLRANHAHVRHGLKAVLKLDREIGGRLAHDSRIAQLVHKKALYPRARIQGLPPRGLGLEHFFVHGVERVGRVESREHRAEVERPCGLHGVRERHEREVEPRKEIGVFQPRIQRCGIEQGRALVALHPIRPVLFGVLARIRTHHLVFPVRIAREYDACRMVGIGVCGKVERGRARGGRHQHVIARKHAAVFVRIGNKANTGAISRVELDDVERPAIR